MAQRAARQSIQLFRLQDAMRYRYRPWSTQDTHFATLGRLLASLHFMLLDITAIA